MLRQFGKCAAGLAMCGSLVLFAQAQEPTAPTSPQPNLIGDDEQAVADDGVDNQPEEAAPELPVAQPEPAENPNATQAERDVKATAEPTPASDRDQPRSSEDQVDARREGRANAQEDRREDVRDRARDRREDRADRQNLRRSDVGLTFNSASRGALVIDQIGPRYFADAGFRRGDRIVSVGGQRFNNPADFYVWLGRAPVGQRVPFVVLRDGRETTVYWTPSTEFAEMYAQQSPGASIDYLGIHIDQQVEDAVVVARVDRDSAAQRAGVTAGDVILSVNNEEVRTPREFGDAIASATQNQPVQLAISRVFNVQLDPSITAETRTSAPARPAPAVIEQPGRQPKVAPQPRPRNEYQYQRRGLFRRGR